MESFEFDESQLGNLNKIATKLFEDKNDPRSISYKRVLVRPKISWFTFIAWIFCPVICILAMRYVLLRFHIKLESYWMFFLGMFLYVICTAKGVVIFLIKVYQRYAPTKIRMKCRFEPSCSEYMVLSIQKYGLIKGVSRGIDRLRRCNVNGGGYDAP